MATTFLNSPIADGPAISGRAVTPSDTTIVGPTRALYVGTTGTLVVLMNADAAPITLTTVPAGSYLPLSVMKVMAATTATNIVAFS